MLMISSLFFYGCGLLSYFFKNDHLLLMLLSLEFMMISVFMFIFILLVMMIGQLYLLLFYLVLTICEGAVGLSLLVSAVRSYDLQMVYMYM